MRFDGPYIPRVSRSLFSREDLRASSFFNWAGLAEETTGTTSNDVRNMLDRAAPRLQPRRTGTPAAARSADAVTELWNRSFATNGLPSDDLGPVIAVDRFGNTYVAGMSDSTLSGDDYVVMKYDALGHLRWHVRYDGPANGYDEPSAIVADKAGNVYVTGRTITSELGNDFLTVKYNGDGILQWAAQFDGPTHGDDRAAAITADDAGNIYVLGTGSGPGGSYDFVTVKYSPDGVQLWSSWYDGTGAGLDIARAIAVDRSGNVYVTGSSKDLDPGGNSYDYATIKYDNSGNQLWARRSDSTGTPNDPKSLAVDGHGNVYVTGILANFATNADYGTIKYDSNGTRRWVATYNGFGNGYDQANSVQVDSSGRVVVTGYSIGGTTGYDATTIMYGPDGTELWVARYDEPGSNGQELAFYTALDRAGNIYVAGNRFSLSTLTDYLVIKYDPDGNMIWKKAYNKPGNPDDQVTSMAMDSVGNVYVTGIIYSVPTYQDFETVSYSPTGSLRWKAVYDGPGVSADKPTAMTVDIAGNVYVTGSSASPIDGEAYETIKYNANGALIWKARYAGPDDERDVADAVAVDKEGNVYVTGYSTGVGSGKDFATVKYNASGVQRWVARTNFVGTEIATALAVDDRGNVYVAGFIPGGGFDFATIKYDSSGVQQWFATYDGPLDNNDGAFALAVDPHGNVYVTGPSIGVGSDFLTIKYDSAGSPLWISRYDGPGHDNDESRAIAVDDSGNVFVTGPSTGIGGNVDAATVKYGRDGTEKWVARYDAPDHLSDWSSSLAIDHKGNVFITGQTGTGGVDVDYATVKYDSSGNELWSARYNYIDYDAAAALALDRSGNAYVTGISYGDDGSPDFATIKYDNLGQQEWVVRYRHPDLRSVDEVPSSIAVDSSFNVYVGGFSARGNYSFVYRTIKYAQTPIPPPPPVLDLPASGEVLSIPEVLLRWYPSASESSYQVQVGKDSLLAQQVVNDSLLENTTRAVTALASNVRYYWRVRAINGDGPGAWSEVWNFIYINPNAWELVSLPFKVPDPSRLVLYPASIAGAFSFAPSIGYVQNDTLENGPGYWVEFASDRTENTAGDSILRDSIIVSAGWNLIGSISIPVFTGDIGCDPPGMTTSQFYHYAGTYVASDSIRPGLGYWVKVGEDGLLILGAGPGNSAHRINVVRTNDVPPPPPSGDVPHRTIPSAFGLGQNYPNPFNPLTVIRFDLPVTSLVSLKVYNMLGQEVGSLVDDTRPAGAWTVEWYTGDLPSGVYFCRLLAGPYSEVRKMNLTR